MSYTSKIVAEKGLTKPLLGFQKMSTLTSPLALQAHAYVGYLNSSNAYQAPPTKPPNTNFNGNTMLFFLCKAQKNFCALSYACMR